MTRTDPQQINQSIVFDSCYVIIQLHITAHRNKKKDKSSAAENSAAEAIIPLLCAAESQRACANQRF
jgi:hypothetical protein